MSQKYDADTNSVISVGAHTCKYYGVNLIVYFLTENFEERVQREFKVVDEDTGDVVMQNDRRQCKALNGTYTACQYYISPENQRFGLMMSYPSRGVLTYQASWVRL